MAQILPKPETAPRKLRRARRFLRREDGAVTIPALLWIVFLMFIMFAGIDMAVLLIKQTLLDRATESTARIIRLAKQPKVTEATLRASVCNQAGFFGKSCADRLSVETFVVDQADWTSSIDNHPLRCEDFSDKSKPPPEATLEGGQANEIILMRVCLREKPMMLQDFFAVSMLGASPLTDSNDEVALVSQTAFIIEPSSSSAAASAGSGT